MQIAETSMKLNIELSPRAFYGHCEITRDEPMGEGATVKADHLRDMEE